jgi:hypothetical protein
MRAVNTLTWVRCTGSIAHGGLVTHLNWYALTRVVCPRSNNVDTMRMNKSPGKRLMVAAPLTSVTRAHLKNTNRRFRPQFLMWKAPR